MTSYLQKKKKNTLKYTSIQNNVKFGAISFSDITRVPKTNSTEKNSLINSLVNVKKKKLLESFNLSYLMLLHIFVIKTNLFTFNEFNTIFSKKISPSVYFTLCFRYKNRVNTITK